MSKVISIYEDTYKKILNKLHEEGFCIVKDPDPNSSVGVSVWWDFIDKKPHVLINTSSSVGGRILGMGTALFSLKAGFGIYDEIPEEVSQKSKDYLIGLLGEEGYRKLIISELRKLPIERLEEMSI